MDLQEHDVNIRLPGHLLTCVASLMIVRHCEVGRDEYALIHPNRII